jgi:hypothetical protein
MITVACVRTGKKYGVEYVDRLRAGVARHLKYRHRFVCLTDGPDELPGYEVVPISLPGWWGKLSLFEPTWRVGERVLFFDLDCVPIGDLTPLADLRVPFGICDNFARLAGAAWPCAYNSSVMTLGPDWGAHIWEAFSSDADGFIERAGQYGDQKVIEELEPDAVVLQQVLPLGFFLGYRDLPAKPRAAAIVVFAGSKKPHNTKCQWVRDAWMRS